MAVSVPKDWWKNSIVYQICIDSFCDSNGDDIGDFCGVISKLSVLRNVGVDVIWLSPVYSDNHQLDIVEKCTSVSEKYGSMEDMEKLISKAKKNGIKIILEFKCDEAWNVDGAYDKMCQIMRFWLDKGVAGFKFNTQDAINRLSTSESRNLAKRFRDEVWNEYKSFIVGDIQCVDAEKTKALCETNEGFDQLIFSKYEEKSWLKSLFANEKSKTKTFVDAIDMYQEKLEWPANYITGKEIDNKKYTSENVKLSFGLNLSLKGTPFISNEVVVDDEDDVTDFYHKMIDFRRTSPALSNGNYRRVAAPKDVYVFTRESEDERLYVFCNMTSEERYVEMYGDSLIFDSYSMNEVASDHLKPYEFRIMRSNF